MEFKSLCIKDSSVNQWIYPLENCTYGASHLLKSRGMFNVPVLDFDLSSLKGKTVKKAWLYLRYRTYPMKTYEISTISAPWEEGDGDGMDKPGIRGIHFDASGENSKWPYGLTFNRFIFGNYNSSYCNGNVEVLENNWQRLEIDKDLVYEKIYGRSFGFAVLDAKAQFYLPYKISKFDYANYDKDVYSKESQYPPYILVEYEESDSFEDVAEITSFENVSFSHKLEFEMGQLELGWEIDNPCEYVFFRLKLNDGTQEIEAPPWDTPKYKRGVLQYSTVLKGLKPDCTYNVTLEVWNRFGVKVSRTITATSIKTKPAPAFNSELLTNKLPGSSRYSENVYIVDEITKVEPVTGEVLHNDLDGNPYSLENIPSLVEGGKVKLRGIRNEYLAFQVIVKGADINTNVTYEGFNHSTDGFSHSDISVNRLLYVKDQDKWHPEVVIPIDQDVSKLLGQKPVIENQVFQAYYVEIHIARDQAAGIHSGSIELIMDGSPLSIDVEIEVLDYTMDSQPTVICDLNGYTPSYVYEGFRTSEKPDETALKFEEGYFRKIHDHRMNYNIVPYSQTGVLYEGYGPEMEGEGLDMHVKSWEEWDSRFEKYFNGTAFKDSPVNKLSITNIYLPFHENWPAVLEKYYKIKVESKDYPALINEHYEKATHPSVDFEPEYREIIKNVLKEFIRHTDEKGWKHVQFQYFLNNKYYWKDPNFVENPQGIVEGTSWWLLDEPFFRDDWHALNYYGSILKEVQDELKSGYNFAFRADLSFCYLQFYYLDGLLNINCTSAGVPPKQADYLRYRKDYFNEECWVYCGLNGPSHSNMGNNYMTPLMAYLVGATGYLPWNCYGTYENYVKPSETALVYPAGKAGSFEPNMSIRLKTLRRAFQDIEYLSMVQKKYNYDSEQMEALLKNALGISISNVAGADEMGRAHADIVYMDSVKIRQLSEMLLK